MLRNASLFILAVALGLPLAGCGGSASSTTTAAPDSSAGLKIAGSTALLPLIKQASADFQAAHPDVKISVSGGGSRVGITQSAQGAIDIGDSDIPPPGEPSLVDHAVAVVSFAVAVHPAAGVKNLTIAQIRDIFSGKMKNWKQAGGADQAITIVNRPHSSGTRAVFVQKIMGGIQPTESGLTQDSSGTVAAIVAQTPGAVSYVASGYVKPGQQTAVAIGGAAMNDGNVKNGTYPFWSYEHMLTKGQAKGSAAAFIAFVTGDTALLRRLHFLSVKDAPAKST